MFIKIMISLIAALFLVSCTIEEAVTGTDISDSCKFAYNASEKILLYNNKECSSATYTINDVTIQTEKKDGDGVDYVTGIKVNDKSIQSILFPKSCIEIEQITKYKSFYIIVINNGYQARRNTLFMADEEGNLRLEIDTDFVDIDLEKETLTIQEALMHDFLWDACSSYEDITKIAYLTKTYDLETVEVLSSVETPVSELCMRIND